MDHIDFRLRSSFVEDYLVTDILINGYLLQDMLLAIEAPLARREGQKSLAGAYEGLPPLMVLPPSQHFWGHPDPSYRHGELTTILEYAYSGVPGDWTLACRIEVTGEGVEWSDFRQLKRPLWNYEELGPYRFDLSQYRDALQKAAGAVGR